MSKSKIKQPKDTSAAPIQSPTQSLTQSILEEVQLATLTSRLRTLGSSEALLRASGEDPTIYAAALSKQYAELSSRQPKPTSAPVKAEPSRLHLTLDNLATWLGAWKTAQAPLATVGLVQKPTSSNTMGQIGGEIYNGDIALYGDLYNSSAQEQWWVNTWQYVVPLPKLPATGANLAPIHYRFNVGACILPYRQSFLSGSVSAYATVFTTSDLAAHPITFTGTPASSTFAIFADLPSPDVPPIVCGNAKVTGSFAPTAGKTPAIGILVGIILSLSKGELQLIPGEYGSIILTNPDAKSNTDIGKIEYRQDPVYLVTAVSQMLQKAQ